MQAWRAGAALELHRASADRDSIRGRGPAGRDTALALDDLDSLRVRRTDAGKTVLVFGGLVPMGLTVLMLLDAPDEL